jgi:Spy/CpxP family protein refolding chaperone
MKKLMVMAFLMVGMTVLAQERIGRHQGNGMEKFTPEQRSQLQLKQMTLNLDLNEAQQKEMSSIIADKNAKIEAHRTAMKAMWEKEGTPTNDERFAMRSKMIDEQIATKKRMEKVLNPKQFEKWNASKEDRQGNRQGSCKGNCQGNQGNRQGNFQGNCQGNR